MFCIKCEHKAIFTQNLEQFLKFSLALKGNACICLSHPFIALFYNTPSMLECSSQRTLILTLYKLKCIFKSCAYSGKLLWLQAYGKYHLGAQFTLGKVFRTVNFVNTFKQSLFRVPSWHLVNNLLESDCINFYKFRF